MSFRKHFHRELLLLVRVVVVLILPFNQIRSASEIFTDVGNESEVAELVLLLISFASI